MRLPQPKLRTRFVLYGVGGTLAAFAVGVLFMAWSGLYSVAASSGHLKFVEWLLHYGMQQSVATWSLGTKVPKLDDKNLVLLGAGHFHSGCAYCHGAPGVPISPVALHMLPPPPELSGVREKWKDRELHWIVKHGIKYTGMPGWTTLQRDDEVWAVVAFLKRLPDLDANDYREAALGDVQVRPQSGREIAMSETAIEAVGACGRCHGADNLRPKSDLVPLLHGQPVEFLANAMTAYAERKRHSGIMQPVAVELAADATQRVVTYYSGLKMPPPAPMHAHAAAIERGRKLAHEGEGAGKIPACMSCHGDDALKIYPRLAGQNAGYTARRLRLWKEGNVSESETDTIMALIAKQLSENQIDDAAAYFSSLRP